RGDRADPRSARRNLDLADIADLPVATVVAGTDQAAAHAAEDDALTQRGALALRPGALLGVVRCQLRLDGQVLLPRQVALVVVLDEYRPLLSRPLAARGTHAAIRLHPAHVARLAERVYAGVGRILQRLQLPRM